MLAYKPIYWYTISFFIKKYLNKNFTKSEVKIFTKNAKIEYKKLLLNVDDLGKNNPMTKNIYGALVFMSFLTANPEKIKEKNLEEMIDYIYSHPFMVKLMSKSDINNPKNLGKFKKRLYKSAKWGEKHNSKYTENWVFNFTNNHKDGIEYHFTKCPLAKFFKENNLGKYTKYFCDMDYKGSKLIGAKLFRQNTIAEGKEICDFWIVPDKIKDPK